MRIIPRATFVFRPSTAGGNNVTVTPSTTPIEVPDWVGDDDLFKLAVADDLIVVPADPSAAPTNAQLEKLSDEDLWREVDRRAAKGRIGGSPRSLLDSLSGGPRLIDGSTASLDKQQERAEAANLANAGKGQGDTTGLTAAATKSGDEKTSRQDAPGATNADKLPASVDPEVARKAAADAAEQAEADKAKAANGTKK